MSERSDKLHSFGLSDAVVELANGSSVHRGFRDFDFPDEGRPVSDFAFPEGYPEFVPITARSYDVSGCWLRDGRLEYLAVDMEEYPEHRVIAFSEQGLWFWLFADAIEAGNSGTWQDEEEAMAELREMASITGFTLVDDVWQFQLKHGGDNNALDEKCRSISG